MAKKLTTKDKMKFRALARMERQADQEALEKYKSTLSKYSGKSLQAFLGVVEKDGFFDDLVKMKMADLAQAIGGSSPAKKKRGRPSKADAGGKRLSKAQMASLQGSILTYIKANPDCRKKDIAAHLGVPTKKLFSPMKGIAGQLATKGVRAGMTFSLKKKAKSKKR